MEWLWDMVDLSDVVYQNKVTSNLTIKNENLMFMNGMATRKTRMKLM